MCISVRGLLITGTLVCLALGAQASSDSFFAGGSNFDGSNNLLINSLSYYNNDSGWIRSDGVHFSGNTNYYTGVCVTGGCGGLRYHGYFSFDLSSLTNPTTAAFKVNSYKIQATPGYYLIYGTSFKPSDVFSELQLNSVPMYNALVQGPMIGSVYVTPADSYSLVTVNLNSSGITWLNAHAGGGAVLGADFRGTPEPGTLALLGSGVVGLAGYLRRKLT